MVGVPLMRSPLVLSVFHSTPGCRDTEGEIRHWAVLRTKKVLNQETSQKLFALGYGFGTSPVIDGITFGAAFIILVRDSGIDVQFFIEGPIGLRLVGEAIGNIIFIQAGIGGSEHHACGKEFFIEVIEAVPGIEVFESDSQ